MTTTIDNTQKITFLKEWNEKQFSTIEKAIRKYFINNSVKLPTGKWARFSILDTFESIGETFGFAYTSSSDLAGYWICNVDAYYTKDANYKYIGFAIGEDQKFYAILWDKDENEITVQI